ncbi:TPA: replication regulatory protein RepA [Salmonella enterica subsp. enterica serovar Paratyphi B]|nr:replication regulatory protein RepA [Salmonella enterica]ESG56325.1 replication protein [Salmonella enterica subsp. enterica serovar Muenchen str. baa1594]
MSQQVESAVTSSSKRTYRKGNPLSSAEKKRLSILRKKTTHKELNVFIQNMHKDILQQLCEENGTTQAQMIELLIEREMAKRA